ncbi:PAS domain S-box protein [Candidatus Cryosericum septentrionale]|jgi:PAS domain S-box-containing protein|uniref:histidine kinase n=1 Tax=Candidatus Cryosericum septentrionale TaxID=2290913 RepID=A0A398E4P0_9BACT|nr:PAS domain S-box protein [Candidatus Cryosericum septentrionale]RIE17591.1 PAS domain S-box protein [Candidatus Cryosericum septentrionale]
MKPALRIIIIEDSPDDALLVVREVEHAGYAVQAQRVQIAEELRDALAQGTPDLVLADYSLPHFSATEGLATLKETGLDVPFIVVSGSIGEEVAVQVMKDGAADCVMKEHMSRLGPVVQRELREADERKHKRDAERALAESEKRYRLLVESQTDLIIKTDPKGRFLYASPTYCALYGKSPQELANSSYELVIHPDDISSVADATAGLFHPPYSCRYEARSMTVGGWRWIEWNAHAELDSQNTVVALVGSGRDITDRKQAEEALRESEENFRHFLDDSPLGVRIVTAEGETMYANRAILDIYGFSSLEELRTTPVEKRYTSESYIEFKKRYERRQQGEDSPSEYEVNVVRKNGEVRHLLVSRKGQLWNGKKQYQLLYRDITESKRAEAERETMQAQLLQSQKMEAIGELAGGVAHDFNNLLTGILGNIAIMRSSLPPADPLLENLNAAETAARQAADLTKGLLTFSRSAMVLPVPMNITAALNATLALLKQSLPATMEIVRDYEQTTWNVLLDQSQMTQILLNLAVNARDAMKGKGMLTIRTRNVTIDTAYVHEHPYARTGEFVHLSVADTGVGIPPEIRSHLFEPFHTTKPIGSGTGMGLSIVYGAIKQAGGWVTADSPPPEDICSIRGALSGAGTVFGIFLPRCLDEPSAPAVPIHLPVQVCSGTVLVVEDEPVVCAVTQALLMRSGCAVLTAGDGASALATFRERQGTIDLVLLDMTMPGMTTDDVVHAMRATDPHVPILLTSGYTSGDTVKRMLAEGTVQGFLPKPYELQELLSTINQLLERP